MDATRSETSVLNYPEISVEKEVLSAIIIDKNALSTIIKILNVNAFVDAKYKRIYRACLVLHMRRIPIDVVTLDEELSKKTIDGPPVTGLDLVDITIDASYSSRNIVHHAKLMMERFLTRILSADMRTMLAKIENKDDDCFALISEAEKRITSLIRRKKKLYGYATLEQIAEETARTINTDADVVFTGVSFIDKKFGGLTRQAISSALARPGHFKSTFTDFLLATAAKKGKKALIISLEDPTAQRVKRIVANELHLSLKAMRFKTTHVTPAEILGVLHERLGGRLTIVDAKDVLTVEDAAAVITDLQPDIVAVDHLQKFKVGNSGMVEGMINCVNVLDNTAIRNNCAIFVTSQITDKNREGDKSPQASDANWTSALYQSSAEMMGLYYPYAMKKDEFTREIFELHILKSRYADAIGKHYMRINPDQARIEGELKNE